MKEPSEAEKLKCVLDPRWRLNNLYQIVTKKGQQIPFRMKWAQTQLYDEMWYCNIVLKARQLGISTFICLLFLDRCLFNENMSAGILAHTLEDGQQMFRRVKFAYDTLPEQFKQWVKADNDTANMLKFSNGSSLRVGTSLRGSSLQYLHISEFGKICAQYPDKAREIITGSLNTIDAGQYVFIESTSEGREGYFYDLSKAAQASRDLNKSLSKLDFKFHFYPWWKEKGYRLGSQVHISEDMHTYFNSLLSIGIDLDLEQKAWYIHKLAIQKDDMKREYPSTPEECWEVSNEGTYYGKYVTAARVSNRIGHVPYDDNLKVHVSLDIGIDDPTAIWFFQLYGKEIRLIEYMEGSNESLAHWLNLISKKEYNYGKFLAPHDIKVREMSSGVSRLVMASKLGFTLLPVTDVSIIAGIDQVRNLFPRMWFDEKLCSKGIKCLENYKKEWDDRHGCWRNHPLHNWASHGADSMRVLATGLHYITNVRTEAEKAMDELESRRDQSGQLPGHFLYDAKDVLSGNIDYLKNRFDTKGKKFD